MAGQQPAQADHRHTTAELVEQLTTQVSRLIRDEMELATAEMKRKGARAGTGLGISGAGGVLALFGVATLIAAAVLGLAVAVPAWLSALIVGAALLLVAGVLGLTGIGRVRRAGPWVPEQAMASSRRDVATVRESVRR